MVDLPNNLVDLPNTMVDLSNTMLDLSNTMVDLPNTMVDSVCLSVSLSVCGGQSLNEQEQTCLQLK